MNKEKYVETVTAKVYKALWLHEPDDKGITTIILFKICLRK